MFNIRPKTYNEALRLSRCMEIQKYAPSITPEMTVHMYNFLSADPRNQIGLSNGIIYYENAFGNRTPMFSVTIKPGIDKIVFSTSFFRVTRPNNNYKGGSSYDFGSNNNNNNNNNNNA